ncbi:hypothetical protein J6590_062964, partial [Homalodisca vitripennis]
MSTAPKNKTLAPRPALTVTHAARPISGVDRALKNIKYSKGNIIVLGDMNVNWLEDNNEIFLFPELFASYDMRQIVKSPTRVTATLSGTIDFIFTSLPFSGVSCEVLGTGMSYHCAQRAFVTDIAASLS